MHVCQRACERVSTQVTHSLAWARLRTEEVSGQRGGRSVRMTGCEGTDCKSAQVQPFSLGLAVHVPAPGRKIKPSRATGLMFRRQAFLQSGQPPRGDSTGASRLVGPSTGRPHSHPGGRQGPGGGGLEPERKVLLTECV